MPHTQDFDWASLLSHKDTAQLLKLALEQDVGSGDITTEGIFSEAQHAHAAVVARAPVVVCGGPLAVCLIERVDPNISVHHIMPEGSTLKKGDVFFIPNTNNNIINTLSFNNWH